MDRDLELRIKGHLFEIREVNDDVLGHRQGLHIAEEGYRKTLESIGSVEDNEILDSVAVDEILDSVADGIKAHIRENEERPPNNSVRQDASDRLASKGIVSPDYLRKA